MTGIELIAAERQRQIDGEGWTPNHDDQWTEGQLTLAAAMYAIPSIARSMFFGNRFKDFHLNLVSLLWPWDTNWWKPGDRIRELQKSGALIAAEIDRLQRKANSEIVLHIAAEQGDYAEALEREGEG